MSVVVPGAWTVTVEFPDGSTGEINLFVMGMMARAVDFRAKYGTWPPSVGKLRLTKASICERFFIDPRYARTYEQLAATMLEVHKSMMNELRGA